MTNLVNKALNSLRKDGVQPTLRRLVRWSFNRYPLSLIKQRRFEQQVLALNRVEDRFTAIYKQNVWGNDESASGWGSTLEYTAQLRQQLPQLFDKLAVRTLFDAPCGDFNWMQHLLKGRDIDYIGGDIVAPLIESLNARYRSERVRFVHVDLIKDKLPRVDLMICRDCLFHLSYKDTRAALQNFVDSGTPHLLTTTYVNADGFANRDIATGDFRYIDLFSEPYKLPVEVAWRVDDYRPPEPRREMCLWSRDQVQQALAGFKP